MHACSNSLMQSACERLKTSAWTAGSQKPALVGPHCMVWPPERPDEPSTISPSLQSQIDQLVGHWLGPINGSHVKFSSANLARHRGFNEPRIPTDPSIDHQGCLGCTGWGRMVQLSVRSCQIYLTEGPDNPMYAHISVGGCGQVAPELDTSREAHRKAHGVAHASDRQHDDESAPSFVDTAIRWHGANLNARLLTVLRLLRAALDKGSIYSGGSQACAYPDFDFELSLDDTCHGLLNGDAQPMFAMVSCPMRTIPVVQWNAIGGRDIDLSRWDATLAYRRAMREKLRAQWHCRRQVAVFRGEVRASIRCRGARCLCRPEKIGCWLDACTLH
ncbi:hypothetical protein AB1Y20_022816 [Prymnesium parvum]|uniref:Uncharacterized protein n=1 Tax=Prymnesium parvum TaxID=97485 RepID=A0AB34JDN8_PRYPA